ncbi:MAG: pilus assembly protein [Clostridia bacterium]|nr:pilus assembly protein [Clostridia bacterium]
MSFWKHRANEQRSGQARRKSLGQSVVELAFTAPILLLILATIIDMGRVIDAYIAITNGVREGARYGSLHPTDYGTIAIRTVNEANGSTFGLTGVQLTTSHVSVSFPAGGAYAGNPIRVTVDYDLPLYFGGIIGLKTIHIRKSADMAIIYSPFSPPLGP